MAESQVAKVRELLADFETAMLITQHNSHGMRARPMAIAKVEPSAGLWFFTGRDSEKVHDIEEDQHVLIAFQDEHRRYLSLRGVADLVSDRERAHELWRESFRTWFPAGVEDPNLLLIYVRPEEAEYWDTEGLKGIRYAFEAAKAYATGTTPRIREGEQHAKVTLK